MNSIDYLDAIRARYECSDYRAAILIGVGRSQISAIRNLKSGFGEAPALKIAELLKLKPQVVLANLMAEKAPNDEVKGAWLEVVTKFAACVVLCVGMFGGDTVQAYSLHNTAMLHVSKNPPTTRAEYKYAARIFWLLVIFISALSNISLDTRYE